MSGIRKVGRIVWETLEASGPELWGENWEVSFLSAEMRHNLNSSWFKHVPFLHFSAGFYQIRRRLLILALLVFFFRRALVWSLFFNNFLLAKAYSSQSGNNTTEPEDVSSLVTSCINTAWLIPKHVCCICQVCAFICPQKWRWYICLAQFWTELVQRHWKAPAKQRNFAVDVIYGHLNDVISGVSDMLSTWRKVCVLAERNFVFKF